MGAGCGRGAWGATRVSLWSWRIGSRGRGAMARHRARHKKTRARRARHGPGYEKPRAMAGQFGSHEKGQQRHDNKGRRVYCFLAHNVTPGLRLSSLSSQPRALTQSKQMQVAGKGDTATGAKYTIGLMRSHLRHVIGGNVMTKTPLVL